MTFADVFSNFIDTTGFAYLIADPRCLIMIAISCVLLYLAIVKGFEPLLLVPIAFGMLLTNLPGANMFHPDYFLKVVDGATAINWAELGHGAGLIDYLYLGVKLGIYPSLIFMGVGAMTDFGPLIANPKSLLMGAGAQFGIFVAFIGAKLLGFSNAEAGSIGIIGGADGPTAIYVTLRLAPYLLGPIAVAAYSYMALVPVIQPPIMKALTTKEERRIEMKQLRPVSQKEKIIFPIMVTIFVSFMLPSAAPLIGLLMLGNLFRESGVTDRLSQTAQNELANLITLLLGITIAFSMKADQFVQKETIMIMGLGLVAFVLDSMVGVLFVKVLNIFTPKNKINPMVGAAGISAFPMSSRVIEKLGQEADSQNHLLMHAIAANVSGQIASVVAGGVVLQYFANNPIL